MAIIYNKYHSWAKQLEEALGYLKILTIYYLRRVLGNVINDGVFLLVY